MHLERKLETHTLNFFQDILEENFVRPKKLQDGYMKFSDLAAIDNDVFLENWKKENHAIEEYEEAISKYLEVRPLFEIENVFCGKSFISGQLKR